MGRWRGGSQGRPAGRGHGPQPWGMPYGILPPPSPRGRGLSGSMQSWPGASPGGLSDASIIFVPDQPLCVGSFQETSAQGNDFRSRFGRDGWPQEGLRGSCEQEDEGFMSSLNRPGADTEGFRESYPERPYEQGRFRGQGRRSRGRGWGSSQGFRGGPFEQASEQDVFNNSPPRQHLQGFRDWGSRPGTDREGFTDRAANCETEREGFSEQGRQDEGLGLTHPRIAPSLGDHYALLHRRRANESGRNGRTGNPGDMAKDHPGAWSQSPPSRPSTGVNTRSSLFSGASGSARSSEDPGAGFGNLLAATEARVAGPKGGPAGSPASPGATHPAYAWKAPFEGAGREPIRKQPSFGESRGFQSPRGPEEQDGRRGTGLRPEKSGRGLTSEHGSDWDRDMDGERGGEKWPPLDEHPIQRDREWPSPRGGFRNSRGNTDWKQEQVFQRYSEAEPRPRRLSSPRNRASRRSRSGSPIAHRHKRSRSRSPTSHRLRRKLTRSPERVERVRLLPFVHLEDRLGSHSSFVPSEDRVRSHSFVPSDDRLEGRRGSSGRVGDRGVYGLREGEDRGDARPLLREESGIAQRCQEWTSSKRSKPPPKSNLPGQSQPMGLQLERSTGSLVGFRAGDESAEIGTLRSTEWDQALESREEKHKGGDKDDRGLDVGRRAEARGGGSEATGSGLSPDSLTNGRGPGLQLGRAIQEAVEEAPMGRLGVGPRVMDGLGSRNAAAAGEVGQEYSPILESLSMAAPAPDAAPGPNHRSTANFGIFPSQYQHIPESLITRLGFGLTHKRGYTIPTYLLSEVHDYCSQLSYFATNPFPRRFFGLQCRAFICCTLLKHPVYVSKSNYSDILPNVHLVRPTLTFLVIPPDHTAAHLELQQLSQENYLVPRPLYPIHHAHAPLFPPTSSFTIPPDQDPTPGDNDDIPGLDIDPPVPPPSPPAGPFHPPPSPLPSAAPAPSEAITLSTRERTGEVGAVGAFAGAGKVARNGSMAGGTQGIDKVPKQDEAAKQADAAGAMGSKEQRQALTCSFAAQEERKLREGEGSPERSGDTSIGEDGSGIAAVTFVKSEPLCVDGSQSKREVAEELEEGMDGVEGVGVSGRDGGVSREGEWEEPREEWQEGAGGAEDEVSEGAEGQGLRGEHEAEGEEEDGAAPLEMPGEEGEDAPEAEGYTNEGLDLVLEEEGEVGDDVEVERLRGWNLEAEGEHGRQQQLVELAIPVVQVARELLTVPTTTPGLDSEPTTTVRTDGPPRRVPRQGWEGAYRCLCEAERQLRARKPCVIAVGSSGTGKTKLVNTLLKHSLPSADLYTHRVMQHDSEFEPAEFEVVDPQAHDPHAERQLWDRDCAWLQGLQRGQRAKVFYPCDVKWYDITVESVRREPSGSFVYVTAEGEDEELLLGDGTNGSLLAKRCYPIPFLKQDEERREGEFEDDYFLLKEGSVLDSTMVPVTCTFGDRLVIRHYFESEATVYGLLDRLRKAVIKAWRKAGKEHPTLHDEEPTEDGKEGLEEGSHWEARRREEAEEEGDGEGEGEGEGEEEMREGSGWVRPQWLQTALAMIGKNSNVPLTEVSLQDMALPPRFKGLLGKLKIYTPRWSPGAEDALAEHVEKVKRYLNHETRMDIQPEEEDDGEDEEGDSKGVTIGERYWRLSRKVVLEIPAAVLQRHDIVDTQGLTSKANAFVQQDLTEAQYVIALMDGRADQAKVLDKLQAEFLEPLTRYALQAEGGRSPTALLAVVVHGEKAFPTTSSGTVPCTVLAKGPPEKVGKLRAAEKRVLKQYQSALELTLSHMLVRQGKPRWEANRLAAEAVQACVNFFYLYSQLLYEPERFHCSGIAEEDSGLPQLREFLRQGLPPRGANATTSANTSLVSSPFQLVRQVADMVEQTRVRARHVFELARKQAAPQTPEVDLLEEQMRRIGKQGRAAWGRFKLAGWSEKLKSCVHGDLEKPTAERAAMCTAERYGQELARTCIDLLPGEEIPDEQAQVGRVAPYLFTGPLKQRLGEPVRMLHNRGEYRHVKLYELVAAPHFDWQSMPFPGDISLKCFTSEEALRLANEEEVGPLWELYEKVLEFYDAPLQEIEDRKDDDSALLRVILQSMRAELRLALVACMRAALGALEPLEYFGIICNQLKDTADQWVCAELINYVGRSHGAIWDTRSDRGLKVTRFYATCKWCPIVGKSLGNEYLQVAMRDLGSKIDHLCREVSDLVQEHYSRCFNFSLKHVLRLVGGPKLHRALQDYQRASVLRDRLEYLLRRFGSPPSANGEAPGGALAAREDWWADAQEWSLDAYRALLAAMERSQVRRLEVGCNEARVEEVAERLEMEEGHVRSPLAVKEAVQHLGLAFGPNGIPKAVEFFSNPANDAAKENEEVELGSERPNSWTHMQILHLLQRLKALLEASGGAPSLQTALSSEALQVALTAAYNGSREPSQAPLSRFNRYLHMKVRLWGSDKKPLEGSVVAQDDAQEMATVAFENGSQETFPLGTLRRLLLRERVVPVEEEGDLDAAQIAAHTEEEVAWILKMLLDFFGPTEAGFKKALDDYDTNSMKLGPAWTVRKKGTFTEYRFVDPDHPHSKPRYFRARVMVRAFLQQREAQKAAANARAVAARAAQSGGPRAKQVALERRAVGRFRKGFALFGGQLATAHGRVHELDPKAANEGAARRGETPGRASARAASNGSAARGVSLGKPTEARREAPGLASSGRGGGGKGAWTGTGKRLLTGEQKEWLVDRLQSDGWSVVRTGKHRSFKPPPPLQTKHGDLKRNYATFVEVWDVVHMLDRRAKAEASRKAQSGAPASRGPSSRAKARGPGAKAEAEAGRGGGPQDRPSSSRQRQAGGQGKRTAETPAKAAASSPALKKPKPEPAPPPPPTRRQQPRAATGTGRAGQRISGTGAGTPRAAQERTERPANVFSRAPPWTPLRLSKEEVEICQQLRMGTHPSQFRVKAIRSYEGFMENRLVRDRASCMEAEMLLREHHQWVEEGGVYGKKVETLEEQAVILVEVLKATKEETNDGKTVFWGVGLAPGLRKGN